MGVGGWYVVAIRGLKKAAGPAPSVSLVLFISTDRMTEGKKTYKKRAREEER